MSKSIALTPVESSQIHSIGHDANSNTLAIRFKNYKGELGSLYHYDNFTADDYQAFSTAQSIGSYFGKHIKNEAVKHPFRKVDETADAGKRRFRFDAGMDISVTVEVDLNILTPGKAAEINQFWASAEEVLDLSEGDVIVAAARRAASVFISACLDGNNELGAQEELEDQSEGWPPKGQIGIYIVSFDVPDWSPSDLEVEELAS